MNRTSYDCNFSPMKRVSVKSTINRRTSRSPLGSRNEHGSDSLIGLKIRQRSPLLRSRFRGRRVTSISLSPTKRMRKPSLSRDVPENNYSSYHFNTRKRSPLSRSRSRKRRNDSSMSLSPDVKRRRTHSPNRDELKNNSFHLNIRGRSPLLHNRYSGRRILAKSWSLSPAKRVLSLKSNRTRSPSRNVSGNNYFHFKIRRRSPILRKRHLVLITAQKNSSVSPVNKRVSLKFRGRMRSRSHDVLYQRSRSHHRNNHFDHSNLHLITIKSMHITEDYV